MTNQTCPTCGKPVDPLRARSVGVRDGKVVAFCSPECARAAETKPTAVPKAAPPLESGPVIEIIREPSTPTPAPKPRPDTTFDKWEQKDDDGAAVPSAQVVAPRPRSMLPTVLALVGLAGVGAAVWYVAVRPKAAVTDATPTTPAPVTPPATPDAVAAPAVSPADAVAKAREVLTQNLTEGTPRVQRKAAEALARTGDAKAIEVLASAIDSETSELAQLEMAYALARAGDKRGTDRLVAGLRSARRDVKAQAGRQLARLGDERAVGPLSSYLEVTQLRLGAAEQLAYLAEPRALEVLKQVRADAKSSPDDRARATIALGLAGQSDVKPDLVALLDDARFNAFAASALAHLADPAARPVLIGQLDVPSLRVEAARSLRVLEPDLDAAPYLPGLLAALGSSKDTDQVQAAEAVLLLAGDLGWSKRP